MRLLPHSLAGRVALTCACAVALAGAAVALVAAGLTGHIAQQAEDAHLSAAAGTLAYELRQEGADPIAIAAHETLELTHTGIRIAIFAEGRLLAGDRALAQVAADTCAELGPLRGCGSRADPWLAVAARDATATREHRVAMARAALVAVVLTTLVGALASFALARAVVKPLFRLRTAVHEVPEHDPSNADLGPDEGVAEVDALRASLQSAFGRLGAALAQSRRFARDAAHELRTPITTILAELELAAERADAATRTEIFQAHKVATRLSTLIDRLLILALPDANPEQESVIDPNEIVAEALEALPVASAPRVALQGSAGAVCGDRVLLVAMLVNALENALKYSSGCVRVLLSDVDRAVQIAIEDEGPGIPPAERERVFAPFYRTRERRYDVPGHGVGLALIAHVVELHRGSVRFAEREHGARLEIELPR